MAMSKREGLDKRHRRIRAKLAGTPERPRLCVHKSLRHIYAQVIDDEASRTLCAATTNTKGHKAEGKALCTVAMATQMGKDIAEKAKAAGVETVVFDRSGYRYHGIIKAFGEAAREAGLKF